MKKGLKKTIKYYLALLSIELARLWPLYFNLFMMRRLNDIQLSAEQLTIIAMAIKARAPCKFLVFGLGNDSLFWFKLNRGGVTIFLEDNEYWFQEINKKSKNLISFLVNYNTQRSDWKRLLESPSLLEMSLPNKVEKEKWDVILVDAPGGGNDKTPGRMKSIYLSSKLVKNAGDVFVHDCNREVEDIYCSKFLKNDNLIKEIESPIGYLRHYHITNRLG